MWRGNPLLFEQISNASLARPATNIFEFDILDESGLRNSHGHWCPRFDFGAFRKVGDTDLTPRESRELERMLRDVDLEL